MISKDVTVTNETGIHARPASLLIKTASKFKSVITIEKDGKMGSAKSLLNLLSLCISKDTPIKIHVQGDDEKEAIEAVVALIKSKFGEE
ncbi:phosphocarrier protein [Anaerovirgula multivorans]|uniref:Phosphocarrier protein HPr n=1 Tax=Anaerovirgula multivorans TaxID=312168 RepID=A0A239IRC9_9FIRM|nr:HPr family phosphocarrier protein [Anaerovirgula multivorans]SNS96107.1 phosphocarrier protein [Anaerovirgula multivorans]